MRHVDIAVIGAGQAGLASAYYLRRQGADFVVLDRQDEPGGAWRHVWRSVRLVSPPIYTRLPGLAWDLPYDHAPSGAEVAAYFADYEKRFDLPIERPARVRRVSGDGQLLLQTDKGELTARAVINATGTWDHPFVPSIPGAASFRGRQLHTAAYDVPDDFAGQHVVVVGGGNSAAQILAEVSTVARTTWVTRRPPDLNGAPTTESGLVAVTDAVDERVRAGLPLKSVVSYTGIGRTDAVVAAEKRGVMVARPMFDRITPAGIAWNEGETLAADTILWCTGFRPTLAHLAPLHLRGPLGGIVVEDTKVAADPRIFLVGYGPSASLISSHRAARHAATYAVRRR
ncbi:FAD-dependent oxidoreductase [Fodinicola acaciae]|uniref:FAD-dependent oxidoreductase n=1 Tax=Fodinicola acaciae TaxID=2681555 RepID=UPI001FE6839F|nr:FAD-dependent oxidoreductase [Fodinicola acaciae]